MLDDRHLGGRVVRFVRRADCGERAARLELNFLLPVPGFGSRKQSVKARAVLESYKRMRKPQNCVLRVIG